MAAGTLLSLREIALGSGVTYQTASKWLAGVEPKVKANRTLGRPARYDYDKVLTAFATRAKTRIAA